MRDQNSREIILKLKREITKSAYQSHEGHVPSAFSVLDILWVLYDKVLKIDPKKPIDENRDHFILSKGHASLALYAVLAEKGFFPSSTLEGFASFKSILGGHPDTNKVPGVEASTGSLGHGMPMAVGMAMGLKILMKSNSVFVLVGDGECNEGTIWESALLAAHHKLDNLTCIIDYNHSTDRALMVGDLAQKFSSFGWETIDIDGHNHQEILHALNKKTHQKPLCIIAYTIKGQGVNLMENNPAWHHKSPSEDEYKQIIKELS